MNDGQSRIKLLESKICELESALAKAQLKALIGELVIDIAERRYNVEIKKDCAGKQLRFYGNQSPSMISKFKRIKE